MKAPTPVRTALRYSSTLPVRVMLAMAALVWAAAFALAPDRVLDEPLYVSLLRAAPRWIWVALSAADGIALAWRLIARNPRIGVTRAVNAATCGMWTMYVAASVASVGYLSPSISGGVALLAASIWVSLRTDMTQSDRDTA